MAVLELSRGTSRAARRPAKQALVADLAKPFSSRLCCHGPRSRMWARRHRSLACASVPRWRPTRPGRTSAPAGTADMKFDGAVIVRRANEVAFPSSPVALLALERLVRREDCRDALLVGHVGRVRRGLRQ